MLLIVVATPRRKLYRPCHLISFAFRSGATTRFERFSRLSGLPDGPRRIGPLEGLPSASRRSARMPASGSMTGTGLEDSIVLGVVMCVCQTDWQTDSRLPS